MDFKETAIDYIVGSDHCAYSTGERKRITKLMKQAEQYPDEVKIIAINEDGSVYAHVPISWFRPPAPKAKRAPLTEEQAQARREQLASVRKAPNIQ